MQNYPAQFLMWTLLLLSSAKYSSDVSVPPLSFCLQQLVFLKPPLNNMTWLICKMKAHSVEETALFTTLWCRL